MPGEKDRVPEMPSPTALARIREGVMTQKAMAKSVGVDPGQLSRWEQGKGEMSYEKIRRYVHVLRTRVTATDPVALLVERIAGRVALRELRPMDPLERAIEVMATHGHPALPVLNARGDDYLGIVTDATVCAALAGGARSRSEGADAPAGASSAEAALMAPIGTLDLAPMVRVTPRDDLSVIAKKLGAAPIVLVEDKDGLPAGFAFRGDLWPLVTGAGR